MVSTVRGTRISLSRRKDRHVRRLFQYTVTDVEREECIGPLGEEHPHPRGAEPELRFGKTTDRQG